MSYLVKSLKYTSPNPTELLPLSSGLEVRLRKGNIKTMAKVAVLREILPSLISLPEQYIID